jgi:hypothetical protein
MPRKLFSYIRATPAHASEPLGRTQRSYSGDLSATAGSDAGALEDG